MRIELINDFHNSAVRLRVRGIPCVVMEYTNEDFDRVLGEIMDEGKASDLLAVPGVYEVVSDHFNNEVLDRLDREREAHDAAIYGPDGEVGESDVVGGVYLPGR